MASMYPAIRATMGKWTYYIVKLKISDLAKEVELSSEVHQDRTLDEAIQREIDNSRARQNLVVYLHDREDRFLNSIVVAALGGSPTFTPLQLTDAPENNIFRAMEVDQSFGVLTFAGGQKYYALDGQHRLAAIKAILQPSGKKDDFARDYVNEDFRQHFRDEEISVIMVVQDPGTDNEARDNILRDYRRLFSSLNRYAKATEQSTNIIMDEDDGIAILTRRLISEHEFFKWTVDTPDEYSIVKTTKGKNLRATDPYFTQIEVLYDMNQQFLTSSSRAAKGWTLSDKETISHKQLKFWKLVRPSDETLDSYFDELRSIWDGIFETMPELRNPPTSMRIHNPKSADETTEDSDHVVFHPIGQIPFARIVRELLDEACTLLAKDALSGEEVIEALKPLRRVNWSLHQSPWRGLLLVSSPDNHGNSRWGMRNEGRSEAIVIGREVLEFILGIAPLDDAGQAGLKFRWSNWLQPLPSEEEADSMWEEIRRQALSS